MSSSCCLSTPSLRTSTARWRHTNWCSVMQRGTCAAARGFKGQAQHSSSVPSRTERRARAGHGTNRNGSANVATNKSIKRPACSSASP
eukprot:5025209-Prymnesium_polylepis.1